MEIKMKFIDGFACIELDEQPVHRFTIIQVEHDRDFMYEVLRELMEYWDSKK